MEFAFWNTLHDGNINAIVGRVPGDIRLTIEIEYLCAMLTTKGTSLHIVLRGCTLLTYSPEDAESITSVQTIASLCPEILSAKPIEDYIRVYCAGGSLAAKYQSVEIQLTEGNSVMQTDLEAAAERYWTEWEAGKHRD